MTVRRGSYHGPRNRPWSVQKKSPDVVQIQPQDASVHVMSDAFNRVKPGDDDELVTVRLPRSILNKLLQEQNMSGSNKSNAAANDTTNAAANTGAAEEQLRNETTAAIDDQIGGLEQEREELEGKLSGVRARLNRLFKARETAKGETTDAEGTEKKSFAKKFAKGSLIVLGVGAVAVGTVMAWQKWGPQGASAEA